MALHERNNPLLFEKDGAFNPTWIFVGLYLVAGLVVCIGALLTEKAAAIVGALTFLGGTIASLLICAVPRDRAKILANAKMPGEVASAIAHVSLGDMMGDERGEVTAPEEVAPDAGAAKDGQG